MKLLTKPTTVTEPVYFGQRQRTIVKTRFNVLGIFGVGPIFESEEKTLPAHDVYFPGRIHIAPVDIDFEDREPLDQSPYQHESCKETLILDFDGTSYELFGVLAVQQIDGRVWRCHVDHFKVLT